MCACYKIVLHNPHFFAVYTAVAVPISSEYSEDRTYPRYIEFPDGEGIMHTVDLEAEPDMELLAEIERNPANNKYLLYTRYFSNFYLVAIQVIVTIYVIRKMTIILFSLWLICWENNLDLGVIVSCNNKYQKTYKLVCNNRRTLHMRF